MLRFGAFTFGRLFGASFGNHKASKAFEAVEPHRILNPLPRYSKPS